MKIKSIVVARPDLYFFELRGVVSRARGPREPNLEVGDKEKIQVLFEYKTGLSMLTVEWRVDRVNVGLAA